MDLAVQRIAQRQPDEASMIGNAKGLGIFGIHQKRRHRTVTSFAVADRLAPRRQHFDVLQDGLDVEL